MRVNWTTKVKGFVKIEVHGQNIRQFLNLITEANLLVWDIKQVRRGTAVGQAKQADVAMPVIELFVVLPHFFRLKPMLRQTGCRLRVKGRYGLPFYLTKIEQRKLFAVGFVCFLVGLFLLSSLIWTVHIEGNETIQKQRIVDEASKLGIAPFQWKFKLDDTVFLAKELTKQLEGVAWVGVEIRGTRVNIKIVESQVAEERPLRNPRHLVSTSDAVITFIVAERGQAVVKVNERVRRGDILVSGILGDEEFQQIVVAEGQVKGLVWHEYTLEVPLEMRYNVFTGESRMKKYVIIGKRAIQLTGYGKLPYEQFEVQERRSALRWREKVLPLGWSEKNVLEMREQVRELDKAEAIELGLQSAKKHIRANLGEDTIIHGEKVLHEHAESGKVYIKVLFEVEQNIARELPIVQNQGV